MIDSILDKAQALGASLAGIARLDETVRARIELSADVDPSSQFTWLLVLALAHGEDKPQLDWWGGSGGTEGNRRLQVLSEELKRYLAWEASVRSRVLPYHPWKGGILLKNAAALAGLGVIGANNLLITPQYGPRVRLKAMLVEGLEETELLPQEPAFSLCDGCPRPCWHACPREAFASGAYNKDRCAVQMEQDETRPPVHRDRVSGVAYVEYCRACEQACPVGE